MTEQARLTPSHDPMACPLCLGMDVPVTSGEREVHEAAVDRVQASLAAFAEQEAAADRLVRFGMFVTNGAMTRGDVERAYGRWLDWEESKSGYRGTGSGSSVTR